MERKFEGVWIPAELYLNEELSWSEKILLIEINSLDNSERGCFASNKYLGDFLKISEGSCANMISKLKRKGYIQQVFFDGRNRGLKVHKNMNSAFISKNEASQKDESYLHKNMKSASQKDEHNSIDNNIVNNKEREQKKSHTPSQKKLSFPKKEKDQKEKSSAQKEKGVQDKRIEPITDAMTLDEPNPAAAEYIRLCAELEAEREAAANKPHESFTFNVNAPIRFTEACKSYIEIARSRNEGAGAAAWTTAKAQNFIKDMERFATVNLLNNPYFAQNPLDAFDCVAEAVEDANRADKQWVMRQSLIMDYCKRFVERKKAIESESKFADIEQTVQRLGYNISKGSLNSLFLKVKELFNGKPTDAQVKASMTRFLAHKECKKHSDLNAVLNNFTYLAKVVSEKK